MNISLFRTKDITQVIAATLIILFFYTASSKLLDIDEFRRQLINQRFPDWCVGPLLWLIPLMEILVSILLVVGVTRKAGFYGSFILMLLFTGYMGLVILNVFDRVPCSCGGVISSMGFKAHFLFNLFFLDLSIVGIYISNYQKKGGPVAIK